jgi:copper chaperone NosL
MAISQPRYAAEIVDREENVYKFDDIGCLLRFWKDHRPPGAALFVCDYTGAGWIKAPEALYVRAESIPSPMGGHTIALKQRPSAEEHARRFQGAVLTWETL